MTEDEARRWIATHFGEAKAEILDQFVGLIVAEAPRQNLISAGSMSSIWVRHIVDSAQLVTMATVDGLWIDVGTGAGFPGVVTAVLSGRATLLVEPRRRRVEFLESVIAKLGLHGSTSVEQGRIETVEQRAGIVSARAVASLDMLLQSARRCADARTQWLLPKGRTAREEVAQARKSWHGTFHVEQSITDPESLIVVANGVTRR